MHGLPSLIYANAPKESLAQKISRLKKEETLKAKEDKYWALKKKEYAARGLDIPIRHR